MSRPILITSILSLLAIFSSTFNTEAFMQDSNTKRSDVPKQYQWRPEHIFKNEAEWEKAYKDVTDEIPSLLEYKGKLGRSAESLKECLEKSIELSKKLNMIYGYAMYRSNVDISAPKEKAMYDRAKMLATEHSKASAYIEPELIKISRSKLNAFMKKEPYLKTFEHYFDRLLKKKDHILPEEEEALLASAGDILEKPTDIFQAFKTNVKFPSIRDEKGKKIALNFTNFSSFRESNNRRVRMQNAEKFFATLNSYLNTFTASIDFAVKRNAFIAQARRYKSSLEAAMLENYFTPELFKALLEAVSENLPVSLHKYMDLRKRILMVDKVRYYDLYNPLVPSFNRKYTYEEGKKEIAESLKVLGPKYVEAFLLGSDTKSGWVDVLPNKDKYDGAYASEMWQIHPYILLNHQGSLNDVSTIAHEFGHGLHYYFAEKKQPYIYFDPETMGTEVASILNEELLLGNLIKKARSKAEKLYLLNKRLENIRTTFFRQVLFAEFEKTIHDMVEAKKPLTGEALNATYAGLVKKYYGGSSYEIGPDDGVEWAYIPHFYYNFYVWKYAAGMTAAIALSQNILANVPGSSEMYIQYLESGSSDYTIDLLKKAGVDLEKKETYLHVIRLFKETVDELEKTYFDTKKG